MTGGGNKEKKEEAPKPAATGRGGSSLYDKTLSTASNLARLLPTGTTTAFQTLAPSFTNHGECLPVNRYFTWALIFFLGVLCALISFTDSVTDRHGNTRYGFVHPCGFTPFNSVPHGDGTVPIDDRESRRRRMRGRDWLHSVFRFVVFVSLAFCDSGVQKCLVPLESQQWREFLVNMPLASGFLASFIFMIFPSSRHGIGAGPGAPAALDDLTDTNADADAAVKSDAFKNSKTAPAAADTRVAPSTSYEPMTMSSTMPMP